MRVRKGGVMFSFLVKNEQSAWGWTGWVCGLEMVGMGDEDGEEGRGREIWWVGW